MNKFWGHLKTITHHRHLVMRGCFRMGLIWQGLTHDLSKYSPTEFFAGVRYFQGSRSPNTAEREANGYSLAWMHHKGRNRHHFEYWTDLSPVTRTYEPVDMPVRTRRTRHLPLHAPDGPERQTVRGIGENISAPYVSLSY